MTSNRTKKSSGTVLAAAGAACIAAAVIFASPCAWATGIQRNAVTGQMFRQVFLMKANVSYQFTTRNLSPGSDTIVHVMSYPDGKAIAGGDDRVIFDPPTLMILRESNVQVDPVNFDRKVFIVVRGKPGTADGTADFRILGVTDSAVVKDTTIPISFSQGFVKDLPSLAAKTHVTTVEEPIGTADTIVMVFGNGNTLMPMAFDDDDGIDFMSFLRLETACTANCQIIVGTPGPVIRLGFFNVNFPPGPVSLVWDETIETSGRDPDRDGLSTDLESMIATNPNSLDSDGDGILDGWEVYGLMVRGTSKNPATPGTGEDGNLLKFPKYGANPFAPDLFTEIDWVPACPASDPTCVNQDAKRITAGNVSAVIGLAAGEMNDAVRAHFDVGIPTTVGGPVDQTNVTFGSWGGANRLSDGDVNFSKNPTTGVFTVGVKDSEFLGFDIRKDCFLGMTPARQGTFHHQIITDDRANGRMPDSFWGSLFESSACALVHTNDASIAHELGHNFRLHHGGWPSGADKDLNCKMNYGSIMSYPNQFPNAFAPGFSSGRHEDRIFSGFTMDETAGLALSPFSESALLDVFETGSLSRGFVSRTNGAIDWNMDGIIQSGTVRAPVNWANTTCGAPYLRANWNVGGGYGVTFPTMTVAEASAAKPQMFALGTGKQGGRVVIGTGDPAGCNTSGFGACTRWTWTAAGGFLGTVLPSLAVAGPYIVYHPNTANTLGWLKKKVTTTTTTRNGSTVTQTTTSYLSGSVGTLNVTGDPAAVEVNGRVKVFYIDSTNTLMGGDLTESTNEWTIATSQWEDGTQIHTGLGIAIAHGAVRPGGQAVFAAIPNRDKVAMPGGPMPIEFARLSTTTQTVVVNVPSKVVSNKLGTITVPAYSYSYPVRRDVWTRIPVANAPSTLVAKPGLAYVPFNLASPDDGRFYLTYAPGNTIQTMFTQGNDTTAGAPARALTWMQNQVTPYADADNISRDLGRGVVLARFGQSVVGATYGSSSIAPQFSNLHYFPAADGIANLPARDYDDNRLVRHNLVCSVRGDSCDESP